MKYIKRIVDMEIDRKIQAFNAVNIVGPKGCGKTRTAQERCNTVIEFQDAPKIWGMIRKACDDEPEATGKYYLTGSTSKDVDTPHTGTGRITELLMYPMTLCQLPRT